MRPRRWEKAAGSAAECAPVSSAPPVQPQPQPLLYGELAMTEQVAMARVTFTASAATGLSAPSAQATLPGIPGAIMDPEAK